MSFENETLGGTYGKILHVDLTTGDTWVETPEPEIYRKLVGGRALVAYLLLRDLPAGTDPMSPENLLIFAPGILQGTGLAGSGRHAVGTKSPLTGALGSSEVGGWWGHEFKCAGYDALVVHGQAEIPVTLWIRDGEVEIHSAEHLWGEETAAVEAAIREDLGDDRIRVAQIGVAGERGVRCAAIMHDVCRAAGRTGTGAVMGSKRLKAVAVRGTHRPEMADRSQVVEVTQWMGQNYEEKAGWAVKWGTAIGVTSLGKSGGLPTRNFGQALFEDWSEISVHKMQETILQDRDTCMACPIRCKQVVAYDDPAGERDIAPVYGGPEYETLAALGSNCMVDDLVAVAKANERCAAYGLDTISAGMVIAFVMECVEHGLLTAEETGGYLPEWGDGDALLEGIELMAHRAGFGDQMARGVAWLAAEIGPEAEPFAVHVKGQELPMHEPRLKPMLGVGYALAPVGADHMMNVHDTDYASPKSDSLKRVNTVYPVEAQPLQALNEEKMRLFYHELNWQHFLDCALVCMFHPYQYEHLAQALTGATGVEYSVEDVLAVGERAQVLSRLFNEREGFSVDDDELPERVMTAFEEGPLAGEALTPEAFAWARRRYYELMGWDPETGHPLPERVAALGLSDLL